MTLERMTSLSTLMLRCDPGLEPGEPRSIHQDRASMLKHTLRGPLRGNLKGEGGDLEAGFLANQAVLELLHHPFFAVLLHEAVLDLGPFRHVDDLLKVPEVDALSRRQGFAAKQIGESLLHG